MTEPPHFEPLFPSHAIERCSAVVTFSEALPSKAFQKMLEQAQGRFRSAGLEWIIGAAQRLGAVGFQVDMASGQTTPLASGSGPAVFATADRATQFNLASNSLS